MNRNNKKNNCISNDNKNGKNNYMTGLPENISAIGVRWCSEGREGGAHAKGG